MTPARHRRGAVAIATGAALVAALPAVASAGQSGDSAAAAPNDPIRLELIDQQFSFEQDQPIRLTYRVTGDLEAATLILPAADPPAAADGDQDGGPAPAEPPPLVVQVTNYSDVDDAAQLDALIGPAVDRLAFGFADDGVEIDGARDLIELQDDGSAVLNLEVPTDSGTSDADHLLFDEPGLHALRVELVVGEFPLSTVLSTAGTVVQLLGPTAGSTPLHLALVGAVAEPPIDADEAALQASAGEVLTMYDVADVVDSPGTWSFPPRVVDELAADARAPDMAEGLAGDELASRPYVPVDVSATAGVDRVAAFTGQLRAGEEVLTDAVPTAPTSRDVWVAQEPLSAPAAQALRDLGVRYIAMTRQLYTASVGEPPRRTDQFVEVALPEGGRLPLLVLDEVGRRLARGVDPGLTPTEYAVRTTSQLLLESVLVPEPGRRSRIVAGPDFGPLDGELVAGLERVAATTPDLRFTSAAALTGLTGVARDADGAAPTITLPDDAGPDLTARVQLLDEASAEIFDAVAMLPGDDPRLDAWSTRFEEMMSTGYSDEEVLEIVNGLRAQADVVKSSVVAPEPFTFTLTGKKGEIELSIGNTSSEELKVVVDLSSPKLLFPDGATTVELPPNEETKIFVPVEARANGTSAVTVDVRSPTGTELVEPVRLTSRVTTFTGLGQVLTGGLVLVLLTWWFTHWRARRRAEVVAGTERHPAGTGPVATG